MRLWCCPGATPGLSLLPKLCRCPPKRWPWGAGLTLCLGGCPGVPRPAQPLPAVSPRSLELLFANSQNNKLLYGEPPKSPRANRKFSSPPPLSISKSSSPSRRRKLSLNIPIITGGKALDLAALSCSSNGYAGVYSSMAPFSKTTLDINKLYVSSGYPNKIPDEGEAASEKQEESAPGKQGESLRVWGALAQRGHFRGMHRELLPPETSVISNNETRNTTQTSPPQIKNQIPKYPAETAELCAFPTHGGCIQSWNGSHFRKWGSTKMCAEGVRGSLFLAGSEVSVREESDTDPNHSDEAEAEASPTKSPTTPKSIKCKNSSGKE